MGVVSAARLQDLVRSAFGLIPALCVVAAIVLAVGLFSVDQAIGSLRVAFLFPGPPAAARGLLSSIIQAMIAFTGLVFSITIVVLQLTSSQFSPRVLHTFLRDRTIQWSLGVFVATFVYAIMVDRAVLGTTERNGFVPRIAVSVALAFVLLSVALFIGYIDHVANMIRVASIIAVIGEESRQVLQRRCPMRQTPYPAARRPIPIGEPLGSPRVGVLVSVNEEALVRHATQTGCVVELLLRVGDFVPAGAPLIIAFIGADRRLTDGAPTGTTMGAAPSGPAPALRPPASPPRPHLRPPPPPVECRPHAGTGGTPGPAPRRRTTPRIPRQPAQRAGAPGPRLPAPASRRHATGRPPPPTPARPGRARPRSAVPARPAGRRAPEPRPGSGDPNGDR